MNYKPILTATSLLMALSFMVPAAPQKPGYLNRGAPFGLRKMGHTRPPVYSLPPLPIVPDPQPLPLTSGNPAQPLNPANAAAPRATIPAMTVPPTQLFKMEAKTIYLPTPAMVSPFGQTLSGGINPATAAFLNPQLLRNFTADANGSFQSRILLNGSSLYTLPTMNPLLPRGSTTFQIK